VLLGAVRYYRRHSAATMTVLAGYLLQTLLYPFTNERRVILVLPVVLACFVLGCQTAAELLTAGARAIRSRLDRPTVSAGTRPPAPVLAIAILAVSILSVQFTRNYLLPRGTRTSDPGTSWSMALLRDLGAPNEVVETDYVWTTALYSGHDTRNGAFESCADDEVRSAALADHASYLLTSGFAAQGIGSPCALTTVSREPWAVRLYRTQRDLTGVYALIGPGTAHPDLADLTAGQAPQAVGIQLVTDTTQQADETPTVSPQAPIPAGSSSVTFQWALRGASKVTQVSLGAAGASAGTSGVSVRLMDAQGRWHVVGTAAGAVGEGARTPFLLTVPSAGMEATAVSVTVRGAGLAEVHDLHALGIAGAPRSGSADVTGEAVSAAVPAP
jgi:hypothetical protein